LRTLKGPLLGASHDQNTLRVSVGRMELRKESIWLSGSGRNPNEDAGRARGSGGCCQGIARSKRSLRRGKRESDKRRALADTLVHITDRIYTTVGLTIEPVGTPEAGRTRETRTLYGPRRIIKKNESPEGRSRMPEGGGCWGWLRVG